MSRSVVITTDSQEDLVLHWGVAKDEPGQWLLPETTVWPGKTTAVSDMSVETPFVSGQGCLPAEAFDKDEVEPGEEDLCYPIQQLTIELPGDGADELMGLQFVIRNKEGTSWFRDEKNGNSNFHANYATTQHSKAADELLETIIRSEAGNGWWTLMHRFNLASTMLEQKCAPGASEKSIAKAVAAAAKIYVWLRYSSNRKLTWQRNYNVKPRELSAAQSKLTKTIAKLFCDAPHLRDVTRLMLGTVGKGGEGGQGQQIRDEILNIMHRNDIKEKKGIWMEEWHQKLHNNTTPDDIIICEAYLAFLKSNMDISEYWRVLSEGGIDRARLESYERPILAEPTPRPTKKVALIKDFQNYLKILKSVHSGADLIECIKTANKGLGGVSPALNYARVAQNGGGDAIQLLAACVADERKTRVGDATRACERTMERAVGSQVTGLVEDPPEDLWERLDAVLATSARRHCKALHDALKGFEPSADEATAASTAMATRVREVVEAKTRDAAEKATELMKTAFARVFSKDSRGLPRTWKATDDVAAANRRAQREAVRVLGLLAVSRLGKPGPDAGTPGSKRTEQDAETQQKRQDAIDAALSTLVQEPEDDDLGPNSDEDLQTKPPRPELPTEWVDEDENAVMLTPQECRSAWRKFEADTAYAVSQALAAREAAARGGAPAAPAWMIAALIVTGFDEAMWLLRNPITLLFLVAAGLFLRAMYNNMDVETAMRMGVVPGLMFLATKVVPTAMAILKKLWEEGAMMHGIQPVGSVTGSAQVAGHANAAGGDASIAAGGEKERVFAPSVSGEGVRVRKKGE